MALLAFFAVTPNTLAFQPACDSAVLWDTLPEYPISITNNAVTSTRNPDGSTTIYSFMGITNPVGRLFITAASYKITIPGDNAWTQIADAPTLNSLPKIAASALSADNNRIFLIGGYTVEQRRETTEKRLFEYDPVNNQYIEHAFVPVEVDDTVAAVFQDRYIYLISGWHGPINNNVRDVQIYDAVTDQWSAATPIIGPISGLFGHSGTIIDNRIIYFDGVTTTGGFNISSRMFEGVIDPNHAGRIDVIKWAELPPHPGLPTYRAAASQGGASTADSNLMLLTGGTDNPYNFNGVGYNGQPSSPLTQFLAFNPVTGTWHEPERFVGEFIPTMDHRGFVRVGDSWVTVGGMTEPKIATNRVQRATPVTNQPVLAPPAPGIAGEMNTIEIACGTPGERVRLFYAFKLGATPVPNCPGVNLNLKNPRAVASAVYDSKGTAIITGLVPQTAASITIHFQALEPQTCRTSNPISFRFKE